MKIHNSNNPEYTKYKPIDKRKIKKKYKLVPCSGCSNKARILISDYKENEKYLCSSCNSNFDKKANFYWEQWEKKHG